MVYFLEAFHIAMSKFTLLFQNSLRYVKIAHSYVKQMTLLCELIHMTMAKYSISSFIKTKNVC
jgi:hypothetical protein